MQRRGRGHLARLDDAGATGGERERQLLRDDEQGEIPRRDDRDHADRLTQHEAEPVRAERRVALAVQSARQRRRVAPEIGRALDFRARLGNRLARFQRIEQCEQFAVAIDRSAVFKSTRARSPAVAWGQRPSSNAQRAAAIARSRRTRRHAERSVTSAPCAGLWRSIYFAGAVVVATVDPHRALARKAGERRGEADIVEQ